MACGLSAEEMVFTVLCALAAHRTNSSKRFEKLPATVVFLVDLHASLCNTTSSRPRLLAVLGPKRASCPKLAALRGLVE